MVCEGVLAEGWKGELEDVAGLGCWVWDCAWPRERGVDAGRRAEVLKVEELENVGEGWTGPSWERRALKAGSGSEASRVIARTVSRQLANWMVLARKPSFLDPLASVWGWTVGPVEVFALGLVDEVFVVCEVLV
jgi:hypothetical protein